MAKQTAEHTQEKQTTARRKQEKLLHQEFLSIARPILSAARVPRMSAFIQHGTTTTLAHVEAVAWQAFKLARAWHIPCDETALVRGAILHDYYLYDWHEPGHSKLHGFLHPKRALKNALEDFDLSPIEKDLIAHHMWPLTPCPPHHREAWLVCLADKMVSTHETIAGRMKKR